MILNLSKVIISFLFISSFCVQDHVYASQSFLRYYISATCYDGYLNLQGGEPGMSSTQETMFTALDVLDLSGANTVTSSNGKRNSGGYIKSQNAINNRLNIVACGHSNYTSYVNLHANQKTTPIISLMADSQLNVQWTKQYNSGSVAVSGMTQCQFSASGLYIIAQMNSYNINIVQSHKSQSVIAIFNTIDGSFKQAYAMATNISNSAGPPIMLGFDGKFAKMLMQSESRVLAIYRMQSAMVNRVGIVDFDFKTEALQNPIKIHARNDVTSSGIHIKPSGACLSQDKNRLYIVGSLQGNAFILRYGINSQKINWNFILTDNQSPVTTSQMEISQVTTDLQINTNTNYIAFCVQLSHLNSVGLYNLIGLLADQNYTGAGSPILNQTIQLGQSSTQTGYCQGLNLELDRMMISLFFSYNPLGTVSPPKRSIFIQIPLNFTTSPASITIQAVTVGRQTLPLFYNLDVSYEEAVKFTGYNSFYFAGKTFLWEQAAQMTAFAGSYPFNFRLMLNMDNLTDTITLTYNPSRFSQFFPQVSFSAPSLNTSLTTLNIVASDVMILSGVPNADNPPLQLTSSIDSFSHTYTICMKAVVFKANFTALSYGCEKPNITYTITITPQVDYTDFLEYDGNQTKIYTSDTSYAGNYTVRITASAQGVSKIIEFNLEMKLLELPTAVKNIVSLAPVFRKQLASSLQTTVGSTKIYSLPMIQDPPESPFLGNPTYMPKISRKPNSSKLLVSQQSGGSQPQQQQPSQQGQLPPQQGGGTAPISPLPPPQQGGQTQQQPFPPPPPPISPTGGTTTPVPPPPPPSIQSPTQQQPLQQTSNMTCIPAPEDVLGLGCQTFNKVTYTSNASTSVIQVTNSNQVVVQPKTQSDAGNYQINITLAAKNGLSQNYSMIVKVQNAQSNISSVKGVSLDISKTIELAKQTKPKNFPSARILNSPKANKGFIDIEIDYNDDPSQIRVTDENFVFRLEPPQFFTWRVIDRKPNFETATFQFKYSNPSNISMNSGGNGTKLLLYFKPSNLQIEKVKTANSRNNFMFFQDEIILPVQDQEDQGQSIKSASLAFTSLQATFFATNIAFTILLSSSMQFMWSFVNSMQLISLIPLMRLQIPFNLYNVCSLIAGPLQFKIIDVTPLTTRLFQLKSNYQPYDQNFANFGLQNPLLILELQLSLYLILMAPIIWLIIAVIEKSGTKNNRLQAIGKFMKSKFQYSFYVRLLIEEFISVYLFSIINLTIGQKESWGEVFSYMLSLILVLIQLALPIVLTVLMLRARNNNERIEVLSHRVGSLYKDIRNTELMPLLYPILYVIRRLIFCASIFYIEQYPMIQISLFQILSILQCIYIALSKPFKRRIQNMIEFFNEISILVISMFLPNFTDFLDDQSGSIRSDLGWVVISLISVLCIMNFTVQLFQALFKLRQYLRRNRKCCYRKSSVRIRADQISQFESTVSNLKPGLESWFDSQLGSNVYSQDNNQALEQTIRTNSKVKEENQIEGTPQKEIGDSNSKLKSMLYEESHGPQERALNLNQMELMLKAVTMLSGSQSKSVKMSLAQRQQNIQALQTMIQQLSNEMSRASSQRTTQRRVVPSNLSQFQHSDNQEEIKDDSSSIYDKSSIPMNQLKKTRRQSEMYSDSTSSFQNEANMTSTTFKTNFHSTFMRKNNNESGQMAKGASSQQQKIQIMDFDSSEMNEFNKNFSIPHQKSVGQKVFDSTNLMLHKQLGRIPVDYEKQKEYYAGLRDPSLFGGKGSSSLKPQQLVNNNGKMESGFGIKSQEQDASIIQRAKSRQSNDSKLKYYQ